MILGITKSLKEDLYRKKKRIHKGFTEKKNKICNFMNDNTIISCSTLTLDEPTPQNDKRHSNNSF